MRNYRVPMPTARTHPSEVLREKFLAPRRMDDRALADAIDLPVKHIREIVRGSQAMTAGIASKLARCFQTTPEFWLNLQAAYDRAKEE
jgi:addiction module HigA family antidote